MHLTALFGVMQTVSCCPAVLDIARGDLFFYLFIAFTLIFLIDLEIKTPPIIPGKLQATTAGKNVLLTTINAVKAAIYAPVIRPM